MKNVMKMRFVLSVLFSCRFASCIKNLVLPAVCILLSVIALPIIVMTRDYRLFYNDDRLVIVLTGLAIVCFLNNLLLAIMTSISICYLPRLTCNNESIINAQVLSKRDYD